MPFNSTSTALISSGQALSAAVDLADQRVTGIILPTGWTAAGLSFQVMMDDANWVELADTSGLIELAAQPAGRYIALDPGTFYGVRKIKVRSGTSGAPVNQAADRAVLLCAAQR